MLHLCIDMKPKQKCKKSFYGLDIHNHQSDLITFGNEKLYCSMNNNRSQLYSTFSICQTGSRITNCGIKFNEGCVLDQYLLDFEAISLCNLFCLIWFLLRTVWAWLTSLWTPYLVCCTCMNGRCYCDSWKLLCGDTGPLICGHALYLVYCSSICIG